MDQKEVQILLLECFHPGEQENVESVERIVKDMLENFLRLYEVSFVLDSEV